MFKKQSDRLQDFTKWLKNKNKPSDFCPYLRQILTDFRDSFTGTVSRKFATKGLGHTSNVLLYYLVKYYYLKKLHSMKSGNGRPRLLKRNEKFG